MAKRINKVKLKRYFDTDSKRERRFRVFRDKMKMTEYRAKVKDASEKEKKKILYGKSPKKIKVKERYFDVDSQREARFRKFRKKSISSGLSFKETKLQMKEDVKVQKQEERDAKRGGSKQSKFERLGRTFKSRGSRKATARRASGAAALLGALGGGTRTSRGAGRPTGSYKYGIPIHEWKRKQAEQRAFSKVRQTQIQQQFAQRGFSPDAIKIAQLKALQRENGPSAMKRDMDKMRAGRKIEDPEIAFKRALAQGTVSPNTLKILDDVRRIHNKGKLDDIRQQRVHRERRMVEDATNLMNTPNLFGADSSKFDLLETDDNILMAPSVFKEDPRDNILRPNRLNILQTSEAGNRLAF